MSTLATAQLSYYSSTSYTGVTYLHLLECNSNAYVHYLNNQNIKTFSSGKNTFDDDLKL